MEWNSSSNLFEGRGRVSTILITLFLSFFAIAMLYTLYHQLAGVRERLEALDPWYEALDQNEKPILWDAYVEGKKLELEWGRFKVSERFRFFRVAFGCGLVPSFQTSNSAPQIRVDAFTSCMTASIHSSV